MHDLETVVDALGFDHFALQGFSYVAPIAVAYAARHPERVSQMVLLNGFATSYLSTSKRDPRIIEEAQTLLKIVEVGRDLGERVFDAIRNEQLYVLTHPEFIPVVQQRFDSILEQRNPVSPETMISRLLAIAPEGRRPPHGS